MNEIDDKYKKIEEEINTKISVIYFIYQAEVMQVPLDPKKMFEEGDFTQREIKITEWIAAHYPLLKKQICKYVIDKWTWERIEPLERAILLFGTAELLISKSDKPLIINTLIDITKILCKEDSYKFINKIFDKIKEEHENKPAN